MSDTPGAGAVLDDRPELRDATEVVLAVDDEQDGWTFDDIPIDSGQFGELVSAGIVEKDGDEYRVADPDAVRAALNGDSEVSNDSGQGLALGDALRFDFDTRATGLLVAALAVVFVARTYVIGSIYRGGDIVLSGNDPYYYRYHVEQVAANAGSAANFGALSVLPGGLANGEPLTVATLWWVASLFGGSNPVIGHVLAWYPVVSALVTSVLLYLLAVRVSGDRRVGLASVLFLAFIPGHAFRTSLGFADHHAFDYPWLGLTALALVVALTTATNRTSLRQPQPWIAAVGIGVGIAGQVLAWEAGPLLVLPASLVVLGQTLLDVSNDRSALVRNAPVLAGVSLGALLAGGVHTITGWQTALVASAPTLLAVGTVIVITTAEVARRVGGTVRQLTAVDFGLGVISLLVFRFGFTAQWGTFDRRLDTLFRSDAIAETYGLFSADAFGFLFLLGLTLFVALPAMVWGINLARNDRSGWLVASSYAWVLLVLAVIQVRFVGELAPFLALFAGLAFVWVASWVDLARPVLATGDKDLRDVLVPDSRAVVSLFVLFLLFGALGMVQVPVKTSQVLIEDGTYDTATAIEADAAERGLEYPENRVLSRWGQNRVYNYFVNGESRSYSYARQTYGPFIAATDPDEAHNRISNRVGYVVTTEADIEGPTTMYTRLHQRFGSRGDDVGGLAHYQPIFTSEDGSHKAFAVVPGGTVKGSVAPNATVSVETTVAVSDREIAYERQTTADRNGAFTVTVANPGTYTVTTDSGSETTVEVTEQTVYGGGNVTVE
ncbi:dolichyl-diphosphooligosaccharide--protein glycosyltransferase [Haloarcula quadrata]|uniref:dolichyl-phosphooligosaccharide-protein glycotransferase n=1 Tax=Haloarcula quadrata TaxID=182779 RepID=A0A495R9Q6_9EURY|nr:STT3 domain-containing protein [Haloarcula quadrata]RKS84107.1 dolichyl-diphosphooligosaccharide--protein glycosyltransferase [Haloarcula quadrata]